MSSDQILDFVRLKQKQGLNKEQIHQRLEEAGWDKKDIYSVLDSFEFTDNIPANKTPASRNAIILVLILAIIGVLIISSNNTKPKPVDLITIPEVTIPPARVNNKENEFTNKYNTFTITKPVGWQIDDSQRFGVDVIFSSPSPDSINNIKFTSNINIYTTPTNLKSLNSFADSNQQKYQEKFQNYQEVSKKEIFLDGKPSIEIISKYDSFNISLTQKAVYTQNNGIFFLITATAPTDLFDRYQAIFDNSIKTIKIW